MADQEHVIEADDWPKPATAWYGLVVLTLGLMIATIDRSILSLLVEPVKRDLAITDTQFSLLVGFAFVFFYAFLGLPISRLADVRSRRMIIGVGMAFWSVATVLCGVAQNYWQLFWARVGVGAGESSFAPATYSILTDSFPPHKLPTAMAVLSLGFTFGAGFANFVGGAVIQALEHVPAYTVPGIGVIRNWQLVFMVVGVPGVLLALIMRTVHEPRRRGYRDASLKAATRAVPIRDVLAYMRQEWRALGPMFISLGIKVLLSFGVALWVPALFIRTYGWTAPQIAYVLGTIGLVVAPLGLWVGVKIANHYMARGYDDANVRVVLIATLFVMPFSTLFALMPSAELAVALMVGNIFFASIGIGPGNAALQVIVPNEMRSQIRALYQFVFNIIGYGLGPVIVALFTDFLFGGDQYIRYSIALAAAILSPLAILVTWFGLRPYGLAVAQARAWA